MNNVKDVGIVRGMDWALKDLRNPGFSDLGKQDDGEFDPGSERTLAARFKHASRAARVAIPLERRTGE
jgi:hypothetical protein